MSDTSIKDFEAAIAELETIVKKLEEGDLPLEQSLALYERGVQLSRFCHARLEEAEHRIEILTERGELKAAPPSFAADEPSTASTAGPGRSKADADRADRIVAPSDALTAFLTSTRLEIDEAIERYLPKPPACPAIVSEAMRYSVFAGGKRLRPILALAAADAVERRLAADAGSTPPERVDRRALAIPAACAIELIHTYSLIHDDLPAMDNDTLRRGRPTLHVVYGDGIAILAGDGLHAEAFALLAREPVTSDGAVIERKLRVVQIIGDAAGPSGMVGGQAIDLQAAGQAPGHPVSLDADGLRGMHARKTGALIRASAVSGALMAGGDDDVVSAVDRFAADLGLAFQIVDDILDVEGNAALLGKTAGKDAADAKPTYPALFGLEQSRRLAAECVERSARTLADARLEDSWLGAIADWVVNRRN